MTAAHKSQMIGRQRNTYGAALGDVGLVNGETVESKMEGLVKDAFARKGYAVNSDKNADHGLSVKINEFWAWFSPGLWTISFEARINCTITLSSQEGTKTFHTTGYGINKGQIASDANWQLAYTRAFENYVENLVEELDKQGL